MSENLSELRTFCSKKDALIEAEVMFKNWNGPFFEPVV